MRLRLAGLSWRSLARQIGVSPQAVQQTASGRPSIPIERALAEAIDVPPTALFAEHWTPAGVRIPNERTSLHRAKSTARGAGVHVQTREVA